MNTKRKGDILEFVIPNEWIGLTVEAILKDEWKVPKGLLHQFRMNQAIQINHEIKPWHDKLTKGNLLSIQLFPKEDFGVNPEYGEFQVLYEDDHLLIANKPGGIDTHPNEKNQLGTLANFVAYHYLTNGSSCKVRHIHRLDKGTTGAVLFAKHPLASAQLDRMLEHREIKRTYVALTQGIMKQKSGIIEASIGRDRHHATRRRVSTNGQLALTYYHVLEEYFNKDISLVMLQLKTGRTHQIRVHMSHLGHPLVGDSLYGGKIHKVKRPALHAANISFIHPITKEEINCVAPFLDEPAIFPAIDLNIIGKISLY